MHLGSNCNRCWENGAVQQCNTLLFCLQANEVGKGDFKYGYFMIDKSATEMAAVNLLVLTGDARGWLLCYFHFLQDWERFIRSAESQVAGKAAQHSIMLWLARLAHIREPTVFETEVGQ